MGEGDQVSYPACVHCAFQAETDPDAILGTHTFEDVLFTVDTETPQIALPESVESQVGTQSKPFMAAAFFHFKATD